jgi:hypothetical protein
VLNNNHLANQFPALTAMHRTSQRTRHHLFQPRRLIQGDQQTGMVVQEYFVNLSLLAISSILSLCEFLSSKHNRDGQPPEPTFPISSIIQRFAAVIASLRTFCLDQNMADFTCCRVPRKYLDLNELPHAQHPIAVNTGGLYPDFPCTGLFEPSPPYSPAGYGSPTDEYFTNGQPYFGQPQLARARNGSSAPFLGGYGPSHTSSRSPVSAGSSTEFVPQWGPSSQTPALHVASSSSSDGTFGTDMYMNVFGEQHYIPVFASGSVRMMSAEERDMSETDDLVIPTTPPSSSSDLTLDTTNDYRYLAAYWSWIHPLFPIVHKPSFDLEHSSPLLKAAMLALGAHMLRNSTDMGNARIIHERCTKVLKKRNINNWHTYRVCDIQAIFLVELYSIYRSRRPPLQFSKNFEDIYRSLACDQEALNPDTGMSIHDSPIATHGATPAEALDEYGLSGLRTVNRRCKQQLLLSCYTLDQQHAMLFGRQRTRCMGQLLPTNLPWPKPRAYWDALPEEQTEMDFQQQISGTPAYLQVIEAMSAVSLLKAPANLVNDAFQSQLVLACLTDPSENAQICGFDLDSQVVTAPLLAAIEQSPRMKMAFHTFMLCRHTPVRDLLAVAGESWVMAEKLSSQSDYTASQIAARNWAKGFTNDGSIGSIGPNTLPIHRALDHAVQILDIHRLHPKTDLLFQEWSIYLAAVVIWARTYVHAIESQRKPRLSIPTPTEAPRPPVLELEQTVAQLVSNGSTAAASLGWTEARNVLLWTKSKIETVDIPHNCGLTNGALDVLGKLGSRGNEEGWFG